MTAKQERSTSASTPESQVELRPEQYDELYDDVSTLLVEINAVDDKHTDTEKNPEIALELAKAKKALTSALRLRLEDVGGVDE